MRLIEFPEQTVIYAEDQPEYKPLPAHHFNNAEGRIACCWQLSWRERFQVFLSGKIWHQILTFNDPLQPQLLTVSPPEFSLTERDQS